VDHRFVWYDLQTTDLDAAKAFYGEVVGFTQAPSGMPGQRYDLVMAGGVPIGGALQLTDEMCGAGARPCWLGYIAVDDIDAALEKLLSLGGKTHCGKTEIPTVGWFAVVTDPQGAPFHLYQTLPGRPVDPDPPAGTVGKVGWRELMAGDGEKALEFYQAMFGWKTNEAIDMGPMGTYQLWHAYGDNADGGMMTKSDETPGPMWNFYFVVDGAQAAADRIPVAGGQVLMGPMEVPGGGWVINAVDPQGALFSLLSGTP
jgi:predicted enzyme related to lactoylglutathione lyase